MDNYFFQTCINIVLLCISSYIRILALKLPKMVLLSSSLNTSLAQLNNLNLQEVLGVDERNLKEIVINTMNWIDSAKDRGYWRAL